MGITESVTQCCSGVIDELGYDLTNVTYEREFGTWELTLYIKSKSGAAITHSDCEKVTHAVDDLLEKLDPTNGASYNLSVSSEGIKGETK